ncbi:MAG TPA: hypothetical protein ENH40_03855 [Nitrospirae bacterium]|nr:hypothetical protein [Nitrospirota bacterium]
MIWLKRLTGFFLSLRTAIWLICLLIVFMFAGALIMPARPEFQEIHSAPMFDWLVKQDLSVTWWLWGILVLLAVITVNTLFCSVESIIKKRKATQWLLLISPQIIHIGFLLILLAHLLSADGASMGMRGVREGSDLNIVGGISLHIGKILIHVDSKGYVSDWSVDIEYLSGGEVIQKDVIRPNSPSLMSGLNVNVKDLRTYPYNSVLLQVSREPGAAWALAGGILFLTGIVILVVLRIRIEDRYEKVN